MFNNIPFNIIGTRAAHFRQLPHKYKGNFTKMLLRAKFEKGKLSKKHDKKD